MKVFLLDKFILENNKEIEGIGSFSDSLSLVATNTKQNFNLKCISTWATDHQLTISLSVSS